MPRLGSKPFASNSAADRARIRRGGLDCLRGVGDRALVGVGVGKMTLHESRIRVLRRCLAAAYEAGDEAAVKRLTARIFGLMKSTG